MYMMFLWSEQRRKLTIFAFVALIAICGIRFMNYGTEFIPKLNEGALYVRATLPNSINLQESTRLAKEMKDKIRAFDEVKFVLNQVGRPNDGSDPTGFFNIEFHIQLHPEKEWERGLSKDEVVEEMRKELQTYPGIVFGFSQPIQDNVEEYVAGVKSSLVVKIFGNDLFKLEEYADQVAGAIRDVEGIEDLNVYRNIGLPELRIQLHDSKMARYGVDIANAQAVVEMAIGGSAVTTFYDEDRMFDVRIRFAKEYRDDDEKIGDILIPTESGVKIPLREIATISYITGPTFIYREGSSRYIAVGFSIEGRDLGSTIAEAKAKVARETNIPEENKVVWAGEFESKERATAQLAVIVPAVLLLILFLLYFNFRTIKDTFIAASTIPFALNTINSIILIAVMKDNFRKMCLKEAISKGVYDRIRPVVMIALMGSLGLLPAALSSGMGSEIQKPLAIMIVGGLLICMILSLTVLPQVFYWAYRKENK
jgi:cobalt-zinc-cadmium resistance protein CzcA